MEEPSILDYIKSRLKRGGERIPIPAPPPESEDELPEPEPLLGLEGWSGAENPRPTLPWRTLLALFVAFIAQRTLEPPRLDPSTSAVVGAFFYGIAAALAVWAWLRGEWRLAPIREREPLPEPYTARPIEVILACVLLLAAFVLFTNNLFTPLNFSLWLLGIILFVRGFWLSRRGPSTYGRLRSFFALPSWQINISRWTVLLLLIFAVIVFYRMYRLAGLPNEPFSDHAEKLLDVGDILDGQTHIFFPRNSGREFFQMYLTVAVIKLFHTGLTYMSLKIGTVFAGLFALPFIYLLGKEVASRRVGLIAMAFAGIAYWPNVISRIGLRFPLYPMFAAPVLYFMVRGLKRSDRNDFILAGLFLGLGLNGYSPYRIMPFVVLAGFILYLLHRQSAGGRERAAYWFALLALTTLIIFLPLLHYTVEHPGDVVYRSLTRLTNSETALPGPAWQIFLSNLWRGLGMFTWDDGETWVHSIPHRPALDVISAGLFVLGVVLVLARYVRDRHWFDLFLLVSIPLMMLPSTLSLAFPNENPSLNRPSGAVVPVFLLVAYSLDGTMGVVERYARRPRRGQIAAWGLAGFLFLISMGQNFDLVFNRFISEYRSGTWNSSEIGGVIRGFTGSVGTPDQAWVVPFPYWVDTRLVGVGAGYGPRDFALAQEKIAETVDVPGPKLYIAKDEDTETLDILEELYPSGNLSRYTSSTPGKDFWIFLVPAEK
jgi:dolichyl-phosphate-mannose-protein mannosyltransferase